MPPPMANPQPWEEPAGYQGADDADDDIADQAEAETLDDQAGEPAGDGADDDEDKQALSTHCRSLSREWSRSRKLQNRPPIATGPTYWKEAGAASGVIRRRHPRMRAAS